MADIELAIKLNEKYIKQIDKIRFLIGGIEDRSLQINVINAIKNGTPLQKGHGRLIDADAFERRCMFDSNIEDMQDVIYALRDYKPIIEADKAESEE